MFEEGKTYKIKMWEAGEDGGRTPILMGCRVVSVEMPLIKVKDSNGQVTIFNTTSRAFVSAELER